jgi:HD superfamily phosphodiesterase
MTQSTQILNLEKSEAIAEVDELVRNYLANHPPTLGHGYSHLKKVARNAYSLALKNCYSEPEIAYVSGLLHDLYRPAMGQAGQEEHGKIAAKESKKLLVKTKFAPKSNQITGAILNPDENIQKQRATFLMKIISIADKIDMSFQRAVAYTWASNHFLKPEKKLAYGSFIETMRDFCHFQVKAWKVFLVVEIEGVREAIDAYIKTDKDLIKAVVSELDGRITYQGKTGTLSLREAKQEKVFLKAAGTSEARINQITVNFSGLLKK